jgi:hypothetical protein
MRLNNNKPLASYSDNDNVNKNNFILVTLK